MMIEKIKILLGDAAANYNNDLIELCYESALMEAETYCQRKADRELEHIALKMAICRLNRINTEGLLSQSFSGVSENYINGYPDDIIAALNRKRKIKAV